MKFLLKMFLSLVLVILLALTGLVLARNTVVKVALETVVPAVTGLPLSLGKLDIGLSPSYVDLEALKAKNPSGFHGLVLIDIPKIRVDYELFGLFKGKAHLQNIEFDMTQFTVVKNEKGELNLDRLRALQGTQKPSAQAPKAGPQTPAKAIPIQIDMMRLKIGKVVYVDYSSGQAVTKEFRINLDQSYQNITDLNNVARLIVLKAMMSSGMSNLVNFDIGGLEGSLTGAFADSTKLASQAAAKSLDALKNAAANPGGIEGQAEGALKGTTGAVGQAAKSLTGAASSLKNKLKNPFGG